MRHPPLLISNDDGRNVAHRLLLASGEIAQFVRGMRNRDSQPLGQYSFGLFNSYSVIQRSVQLCDKARRLGDRGNVVDGCGGKIGDALQHANRRRTKRMVERRQHLE